MAHRGTKKYSNWRTWLTAIMLVVLVGAIIQNWSQVTESVATLRQMTMGAIILMVVVFIATIAAAALSYYALALHTLRFAETALVELAASGINRVLPAGTGSIGIHALFLTRRNHSVAEAAAVVSVNNLIGFAEHISVLLLLFLFVENAGPFTWHLHIPVVVSWLLGAALVLMIIILSFSSVRRGLADFWRHFVRSIGQYRTRPKHLLLALIAAIGVTFTNFIIFAIAAHAFHIDVGIPALFLAFTLGVLVGSTLPTPGGLGGVEAGLVAGLVARGVDATPALAAAIAFRLITYWLPLLVGTPAFFAARARKLV